MLQQKFNLAGVSFALVRKGESRFKGYLREKDSIPCTDPAMRTFDGLAFDEYAGKWRTSWSASPNRTRYHPNNNRLNMCNQKKEKDKKINPTKKNQKNPIKIKIQKKKKKKTLIKKKKKNKH